MINCEKCGAEAEGGATCPRCGAALPADRSAKPLALASNIIGAACGFAAMVEMAVDLAQNGALGWSLIGLASSTLAWLLVGFPMRYYRRPALFLPIMGVAVLAYLWMLDALAGDPGWFFPLALPIALSTMASGALSTVLSVRAKQRGPNIGAFVLFGCTLTCLAIETTLSLRFDEVLRLSWSLIVAAGTLPTAFLLLGIQGRLRQALSGT